MRQLRDSHTWQKLVAKDHKKGKLAVKPGHHLESEDGVDDFEEERDDDDDDDDEIQSNTTLKRGRSLNEDVVQSRPQPKRSRSDVNNHQRSVQLGGTSDGEASRVRPPPQSTGRLNIARQQSFRRGGTPVDPRAHEALPNHRQRSVVQSTRRPSPTHHDSFVRPSTSTRPRLPPQSGNFSRPRRAEWSDDDNAQFGTLLRPHQIETRGQFIPQAEADSRHPRDSRLQQSYQRHSNPRHPGTNIPPRAGTSQGHAAHSIPHHSSYTSMPSNTQQHHPASYHRTLHRSLRSPERYRGIRASPIEEEVPMGGQLTYPGRYSGYHQGQDYYSDGGYFDDTYGGEDRSEGVIDEYNEE